MVPTTLTATGTALPTGRGWAYTGVVLGVFVSVAANVAHSYVPPAGSPPTFSPPLGSVIAAVFWPIALFVVIEIMARNPWPPLARWKWLRFGGLTIVATVAAIVSYRHQAGLLAFYGEDTLTATIGPLAVDGLMVMATGALIATSQTHATTVAASPSRSNRTAPAVEASPDTRPDTRPDNPPTPDKPKRRTDTRAAVAALRARHPDMTQAAIAAELRVSRSAVASHWKTTTPDPPHLAAVREA